MSEDEKRMALVGETAIFPPVAAVAIKNGTVAIGHPDKTVVVSTAGETLFDSTQSNHTEGKVH